VSALTESSDYYFYNLGYLFWSQQAKYGQTPIQNVATLRPGPITDIDLPTKFKPSIPEVRKELHAECLRISRRDVGIRGQHRDGLRQARRRSRDRLANAYATFRHGGKRYAPEVAARSSRARSDRSSLRPRVLGHVSAPRVRDPILQGLEGVVMSPSARRIAVQGQHQLLAHLVSDRGQDGTASTAGSTSSRTRGSSVSADHAPEVRRTVRDRRGWLRRRRGRPGVDGRSTIS